MHNVASYIKNDGCYLLHSVVLDGAFQHRSGNVAISSGKSAARHLLTGCYFL